MPENQEQESNNLPAHQGDSHWRTRVARLLPEQRPVRITLFTVLALLAGGGLTYALQRYFTEHIARRGPEQSLVVQLDAPYGSVNLGAGNDSRDVATIETLSDDAATHNCQWSYGVRNGTVGTLRIGIGTDEGMRASPPIALNYANSPYSLARDPDAQSDMGSRPRHIPRYFLSPIPGSMGYSYEFVYRGPLRSVSTDAGTRMDAPAAAGTQIFLTRNLPIDLSANLGFGISQLNLSGLPLMNAFIETEATQAFIYCNSENPEALRSCAVRAGMGPCTFTGISNLNAYHFAFHGAVGSYHLGFDGRLLHNLDATVEVGLGFCTIAIPPTAGRVQIFYDDGFGSSFTFSGLSIQRDGYATSPGFEYSRSPILTLHLSSGLGRIAVSYH